MKRVILLLTLAIIPLLAEAQTFTPDQPEDRGVFLFLNPNINGINSRRDGPMIIGGKITESKAFMIMGGEEVFVERLDYNGWARVNYTNKDGIEYTGYLRIRSLKPLDDTAAEMLALAESRADLETKVITIGFILAGIGLLLSFLPLGKAGAVLQLITFLGLCALEIWFLRTTEGFTIYSPSVYTWKTAIKWAVCFVLFLTIQIKLWLGILNVFVDEGDSWIEGFYITMILSLLVFVALMVTVFLVPSKDVDVWFWRVYYGYLALNLIQVIKNFVSFGIIRGLFFNIFLAVGLYAITLMAVDMVVVVIIGILTGAFLTFVLGKYAKGGFMQFKVRTAGGRIVTKWGDEIQKGDRML
jgi:hypothetical protein